MTAEKQIFEVTDRIRQVLCVPILTVQWPNA